MGLLSFLSRKNPEAGRLETQFKGQAYDATTPSLPPIRGAYPVSGNGPSVLNELQRAAKKRSQSQLGPPRTTPSAPSPLVPRLRSHSQGGSIASLEVDTASLSSRPRSQGRRHRASSRAPSLLGWTSRRDSSHARSEADRDAMTLAPPVPRIPDRHKRDGSSSMGSSRRRGHVDLLDAQSEFKPSDFRSRVQAGGARDYGEDVAERNLGVNGVNLESPAVKAFYALTGGAALAYRSDGSAVDVHGNMYQAERIPQKLKEAAPQTKRKEGLGWNPRGSAESEQRMRNALWDISSKHHDDTDHRMRTSTALERTAETEEREAKAFNRQASVSNRRNSLQDFILSNTLGNSPSSRPKQRPLSMHPAVYVQTGAPAPPPAIPRYRPSTSEGLERSPPTRASTAERLRGLGSTSKQKRREDDTDSHGGSTRGRRSSLSRKKAHGGGSFSSLASHNRHDSSDDGDIDSSAPAPGIGYSGRLDHQNYSRPTTQHSWRGSREDSRGETARPSTSSAAQPTPSSSHPRSRSIGGTSSHGRSKLDDIIEHIPVRKSSLYPVNLSLVTPTTTASNHSSNFASQSDDYNTGDTSIDQFYDYEPPRTQPQPQPQHHSRAASSNAATPRSTTKSSYRTKEEEALTELLAAHRRGKSLDNAKAYKAAKARNSNGSSTNIDDYASATTDGSDIDSFIEKHKQRQRDNEGTFFTNRDYQDLIKQLPGLFDGVDARSRATNGSGTRTRDTPRSLRPQDGHVQAPVYQFSSEDFDSDFASDMDYDDNFDAAQMTLAALSNRAGAQGLDLFDLLDDMPDEKMDARTAVKVRKELKRQKRIDTLEKNERSNKTKGKRPMRPRTTEGVSAGARHQV